MQISDGEWVVMNLIWEAQPIEANDVIERLAIPNQWSAATVKTMLHRLVKKGALATEVNGKRYIYRSNVRRADCVRRESKSFLERVFGGQAAPALLHLVKTSRLSAEQIAELKQLLDSMDSKNKDQGND